MLAGPALKGGDEPAAVFSGPRCSATVGRLWQFGRWSGVVVLAWYEDGHCQKGSFGCVGCHWQIDSLLLVCRQMSYANHRGLIDQNAQ